MRTLTFFREHVSETGRTYRNEKPVFKTYSLLALFVLEMKNYITWYSKASPIT